MRLYVSLLALQKGQLNQIGHNPTWNKSPHYSLPTLPIILRPWDSVWETLMLEISWGPLWPEYQWTDSKHFKVSISSFESQFWIVGGAFRAKSTSHCRKRTVDLIWHKWGLCLLKSSVKPLGEIFSFDLKGGSPISIGIVRTLSLGLRVASIPPCWHWIIKAVRVELVCLFLKEPYVTIYKFSPQPKRI